jgi:serine/threonine-protein kinase
VTTISSRSRAGDRARVELEQDREERRIAVARALVIGAPVWLSFFSLDLFCWALIGVGAPLVFFVVVRAVVAVPLAAGAMVTRRPGSSDRSVIAWELIAFGSASLGVAVLATRYGGLTSRYVQGMSIVIMYHAAAVPDPWWRKSWMLLAQALLFPATMAVAALFDGHIAAQWRSPMEIFRFIESYVFVVGTALMGSAASHLVWAARKQVFEARKLGRYRLKMRIGAGGSGEVWLATDEQQKRDVAVKILDRDAANRPGARARFEREAKAAMSLSGPHTIRVFDYGASDDGVCYIAMELLDGADLGTLVKLRGPMPTERVIHFARQACQSLAEAHEAGILHRDVKPENLFATRRGDELDVLTLLDFGLAKVARPEDDATLTQGSFMGGTPLFMAPEVCAGLDADVRSDLYSLGGVMYFLVCGRPPFAGESAAAVMNKHIHEAPRPPSEHAPVQPELERIILRCLSKRVEDRFASARALDAALKQLDHGWSREQARAMWSVQAPTVRA